MITDQIADLLTRIRNAQRAGHPSVYVPASGKKRRVLELLAKEGYIEKYEITEDDAGKPAIKIYLKYGRDGQPVIRAVDRISSPGRRVYMKSSDIPYYKGGLGIVVVSTSKGVMTDREARQQKVGGEVLCSVF